VYKGCKRSTKQEASIFVFEKRQLEKWNKSDREIILESLRRGVTQLTKIRHPQILTVQHPLEESRESLAFATEPVFASLANVLGKTTNMPQPANMSDYKLYDIEIKYGLLQISEGLAFLHNDVKLLHKNVCPESIVINKQGAWKIFGLDFCVHNTNPANLPPSYPHEGFCPTLPDICQSNLEYLAPECVLTQNHSPASDMFSVGMLAYMLNSPGNQPYSPVKDLQQFRARTQQLKNLNLGKLQCVPEALREYVKLLLNVSPEIRPDAHQFIKIPYFDDVGIKTLTYLDSLLQWDNLQKSQFYKGLPEALPKLPQRVKVQRVLSCLSRDLTQPAMVPFVLPSILDIAQECTKEEYCSYVLPHLKPVMKLMEPIQILLIMLQRMELLLKLTPAEDVQQHVLPMLYRGLDSDTPQVHELCLSVLPTFAGLLDHSNVKNSLLPRIKRLCLSTSSLSVRVNCLLCVGRLLEHLDKWLVLDEILPFLPQIPSREPAVLMGILGIYKLAMNHKKLGISKEVIATRILPFLMPLCIENGLTLVQFNALVALVKDMFQLVETEHRTKLEQLNSVKDEQKVLAAAMPSIQPSNKPQELDQAFTGLGLDSFVSMSSGEKQKVAKQQDSFKAFTRQPALEPVKPVATNPISPPKNLASSLMSDWTNANAQGGNVGFGGGAPTMNANMMFTPQQNHFHSPSTWSSNNHANRSNNAPQNWNALDKLLPVNNAKIPMNQMIPQKQPLIPSPNVGLANPNNNALSKDDIMDLLS
jgi:SCY1-like protein 2